MPDCQEKDETNDKDRTPLAITGTGGASIGIDVSANRAWANGRESVDLGIRGARFVSAAASQNRDIRHHDEPTSLRVQSTASLEHAVTRRGNLARHEGG